MGWVRDEEMRKAAIIEDRGLLFGGHGVIVYLEATLRSVWPAYS